MRIIFSQQMLPDGDCLNPTAYSFLVQLIENDGYNEMSSSTIQSYVPGKK